MIRKIIKIEEEKCNGCGLCVPACAEGAIRIVDGKARLISDVYCDGLGACIGECPQGALTIEERDAEAFDENVVNELTELCNGSLIADPTSIHSCPGSLSRMLKDEKTTVELSNEPQESQLGHWPVQLMLIPPEAPYLKNADILVCADCVPFTVPDFHRRYLSGRVVLVGCPKLDNLSHYRMKLAKIFSKTAPNSITVLRMEVPCCGGISGAVIDARDRTIPGLPVEVHTVGIHGDIHRDSVP